MSELYSTYSHRADNFRTYKRREVAYTGARNLHTQTSRTFLDVKPPQKNPKAHIEPATHLHRQKSAPKASKQRGFVSAHKPTGKALYVAPQRKFSKLKRQWQTFFTPKYMLPAMAVSLFFIGLGVSLQGFYQNHRAAEAQAQQGQVAAASTDDGGNADVPDETEPTPQAYSSYVVAPDLPRYVRIQKIGLNARVQRVGIKNNGELRAPNNIYNVGWYENSAKPGDAGGATLLDAHVHGPTRPGAFYKLKNVSAGDVVEIERGDGQVVSYKVVSKESVPTDKVDMAKALVSVDTAKAGLTLITCDGKLNTQTQDYENRLVVYAVRI